MQLRSARLCLDCEELHEEPQCPICASEAFVFLTRWIPVDERRNRKRRIRRPAAPPPRVSRLVKSGALGLAMLATARWLWRNSPGDAVDSSALRSASDDRGDSDLS
jgi:hypothetical protein